MSAKFCTWRDSSKGLKREERLYRNSTHNHWDSHRYRQQMTL